MPPSARTGTVRSALRAPIDKWDMSVKICAMARMLAADEPRAYA